jgi:hypothetical protein
MDPGSEYNIDPSTLPISSDLIIELLKWASAYDATLNQDDPSASGFPTRQDAEDFEREGIRLWRELQTILSPEYQVWYFSEQQQELLQT